MHLTQIKFVLQGTAHAELKIKILAQKQKVDFEIHYDQSLIGTACLAKIIEDIYIYIYIYIYSFGGLDSKHINQILTNKG